METTPVPIFNWMVLRHPGSVQTTDQDPAQPDLEVLMEVWNSQTEAMKQYYLAMVRNRRETS